MPLITTTYLVLSIYGCTGGGIDPGIVQGACVNHDQRVVMPTMEICRKVRDVNQSVVWYCGVVWYFWYCGWVHFRRSA